ncbi:hypothetical protein QBC40DRAFT_322307 [Triangularia verruculosa]|uniref:Nephrocystin 3-like N-terminal domain-containing protein n=1 Tax=Triangularia verruculosa TaxID=2587418 RepID=A0AAN6XMT8_9PEZI|nr:hypothetical protein QBC40DRAFT_322307 [Triangularia verruculosa]
MAEVAGLVSTIFTIIAFARDVTLATKFYVDAAKGDCPKDIKLLVVEAASLQSTFESIDFIFKNNVEPGQKLEDSIENKRIANQIFKPCEICKETLEELQGMIKKLRVSRDPGDRTTRDKVRNTWEAAKWPFKKESFDAAMGKLHHCRTSIISGLTTELTTTVKEIQTNVRVIKDDVKEVKGAVHAMDDKMDREAIAKWLSKTNPSDLHSKASQFREPNTCRWLPNSSQWKAWVADDSKTRLLWIHGVPGVGKTVLSSYIVEQYRNLRQPYAFYYCSSTDERGEKWARDETAHCLGWILARLCLQVKSVPAFLKPLKERGMYPTVEDLLKGIEAVLSFLNGKRAYVIIDAVDESKTPNLAKVIATLSTDARYRNLFVVATSRRQADVQKVLEKVSISVSLDRNADVDNDIKAWVTAQLQKDDFEDWNDVPKLKEYVAFSLPSKARGMFRYAAWQLEVLKDARDPRAKLNATRDRPESLDGTWETILANIPEKHRDNVIKAFALILSSGWRYGFASNLLIQAIQQSDMKGGIPFSIRAFTQACGPLIQVVRKMSADGKTVVDESVGFAHHTVRDFLISDRLKNHKTLKDFYLDESDSRRIPLTLSTYLEVTKTFSGTYNPDNVPVDERMDAKDLRIHAMRQVRSLLYHQSLTRHITPDAKLRALTFEILNPQAPWYNGLSICTQEAVGDSGVRDMLEWLVKYDSKATGIEQLVGRLALVCSLKNPKILSEFLKTHLKGPEDFTKLFTAPFKVILPAKWSEYKKTGKLDSQHTSLPNILEFYLEGSRRGYAMKAQTQMLLTIFGSYLPQEYNDIYTNLAFHDHSLCASFGGCSIKKALSTTAKQPAGNFSFTPLQAATHSLDMHAVEAILSQPGLNVNQLGDPTAPQPPIKLPRHFASSVVIVPGSFPLNGQMSPLYILQKGMHHFQTVDRGSFGSDALKAKAAIQAELEKRGGKCLDKTSGASPPAARSQGSLQPARQQTGGAPTSTQQPIQQRRPQAVQGQPGQGQAKLVQKSPGQASVQKPLQGRAQDRNVINSGAGPQGQGSTSR